MSDNFWQRLRSMFEEELRSCDFAQRDFDKILNARIERAEGRGTTDPMLLSLAERCGCGTSTEGRVDHERGYTTRSY